MCARTDLYELCICARAWLSGWGLCPGLPLLGFPGSPGQGRHHRQGGGRVGGALRCGTARRCRRDCGVAGRRHAVPGGVARRQPETPRRPETTPISGGWRTRSVARGMVASVPTHPPTHQHTTQHTHTHLDTHMNTLHPFTSSPLHPCLQIHLPLATVATIHENGQPGAGKREEEEEADLQRVRLLCGDAPATSKRLQRRWNLRSRNCTLTFHVACTTGRKCRPIVDTDCVVQAFDSVAVCHERQVASSNAGKPTAIMSTPFL